MKKIITIALSLFLLAGISGQSVHALDTAPGMGGYTQDAEGFSQCYSDYMEYYLYGIDADTRSLIREEVRAGYEDGSIEMMSLMSAYANLRRAGQAAETEENQVNGVKPEVDVIKKYYTLTDTQKESFASCLADSLAAVKLSAEIKDGTVIIQKAGEEFAKISLVTEKPVSTTRIYLNAYLPGVSDEVKDIVEALAGEYSAAGGGPAGTGALWRCIREIGQYMGVEAASNVDMAADTVTVTVTKQGDIYLRNSSVQVRKQVIAKAHEAFAAIDCTSEYAEGVFTVKKDGAVRLSYTVIIPEETGEEAAFPETGQGEQEETESEQAAVTDTQETAGENTAVNEEAEKPAEESSSAEQEGTDSVPRTGEKNNILIYLGGAAALFAVLSVSGKKRMAKGNGQ